MAVPQRGDRTFTPEAPRGSPLRAVTAPSRAVRLDRRAARRRQPRDASERCVMEGPQRDEGPAAPPKSFAEPVVDPATALAAATKGLVSKDEFTRRREELEASSSAAGSSSDAVKKKKKKKTAKASTLSFDQDDEAEDDEAVAPPKKLKLGKNPDVDSSFLPDKERDEAVQRRREELARAYTQEQDAIKAEIIEVTYSFWDGKGSRKTIEVPKGFSIGEFLNKCRDQARAARPGGAMLPVRRVPAPRPLIAGPPALQVRELRNCSPADLIYVKEDLILPHHVTFYELITKKARGKSGPLFHFDVHDDVRMGAVDHRVEKDESHAGKVMEKRLYERHVGGHFGQVTRRLGPRAQRALFAGARRSSPTRASRFTTRPRTTTSARRARALLATFGTVRYDGGHALSPAGTRSTAARCTASG